MLGLKRIDLRLGEVKRTNSRTYKLRSRARRIGLANARVLGEV